MIFKRRDPKPFFRGLIELVWPRGGWGRAFHYIKHRVRRLPDSPERIARGIWAGVFTTFTPFYGMHFVVAGLIALAMRGNILASLMATFFGNPLTYVPIGIASLRTGYSLLGLEWDPAKEGRIAEQFGRAFGEMWDNLKALFTDDVADWTYLIDFYERLFFPYMVGGILPGMLAATICYYLSVPVIRAYQQRRKGLIADKIAALKAKADAAKADLKK